MTAHIFKKCLLSFVLVLVLSGAMPLIAYAEVAGDTIDTSTATQTDTTTVASTSTTTETTSTTTTETIPTLPQTEENSSATNSPNPEETTPTVELTENGASSTGNNAPTGASAATYIYNSETGLWENDYYTWDPVTHLTTPKTPQTYSYNPETRMWDTTEWQYDTAAGKYVPNVYSTVGSLAGIFGGSTNGIAPSANIYNGFYNAAISNGLTIGAFTGDAIIDGNTFAGSALSGDALAIATILNILQSNTGFGRGNINTFVLNLPGGTGDILLTPQQIGSLAVSQAVSPVSNLTVNSQANGQIVNDIAVGAATGNATITSNTVAGAATSGNANAIANIINVINSAISAGNSFIGAINVLGNLNGDILLPLGLLDTLIASNVNSPTLGLPQNINDASALNTFSNQAVTNTITTTAATGNATSNNNTSSGNINTGNARSNVTILNLTGSNVVAANNLLVFVNVLGQWVGMIINAPNGATAASLAGGVTNNSLLPINSDVNSTVNNAINNTILVGAESGDAIAENNTQVGDVASGNASASVNLANLLGSNISLSEWFGILFINIFGDWNGWFGKDTAAGNPTVSITSPSNSVSTPSVQVFAFTPTTRATNGQQEFAITPITLGESPAADESTVLATSTDNDMSSGASTTIANQTASWIYPVLGLLIAALLLAMERIITRRNNTTVIA